MDPLVRRWRLLLSAIASASLAAACVRASAGSAVGTSERVPAGGSGAAKQDAGFVDGAGALPAGYRTAFKKLNAERVASRGHAPGRWEIDVYANEGAVQALAARAREAPVGATVVVEHYERADRSAGPVMLMEKRPPATAPGHGDWRWVVVGSQGQLVQDGVIESCAGCHDDAPMDGLFPIVD